MIKQLIGMLVTLAVLAVVVLTILHRDRFESMLRFETADEMVLPQVDSLSVSDPVSAASAVRSVAADSAHVSAPVDSVR